MSITTIINTMNNNQPVKASDFNSAKVTIFSGDYQTYYLYKKTERLTVAIYMLSGFISDSEPIKWEMRSLGVSLLSDSLSFTTLSLAEKKVTYVRFAGAILKAISLLEIAYIGGLISLMNYEILRSEFEGVLKLAESSEAMSDARGLSLPKHFFNIPEDNLVDSDENRLNKESLLTKLNKVSGQESPTINESIKYKGHSIGHNIMSDRVSGMAVKTESHKQKDKTNRQEIIIDLLKKKGDLGIKDFTNAISGCSEKTIQRELLTLVSKGQISKAGSKRWSRYSFKS